MSTRDARTVLAVTFDFGQTLCELDTELLAQRLGERGVVVATSSLEGAVNDGWLAYDAAIVAGLGGHPWGVFMDSVLARAGVVSEARAELVAWLWSEQPRKNLWRRPISGMIELVDELRARDVPVGVVSNSEGRLAELIDEVGWGGRFDVIADSGKLGMEKPGEAIFRWTASQLAVAIDRVAHVGDSFAADVAGALQVGNRAVWFRGRGNAAPPLGARTAEDAEGVRRALLEWGVRP